MKPVRSLSRLRFQSLGLIIAWAALASLFQGCSAKKASFGNTVAIPGARSLGQLSVLASRSLPGSAQVGVIIPDGVCMGFFVAVSGTHSAFSASLQQSGSARFYSDPSCSAVASGVNFASSDNYEAFYVKDAAAEIVTISVSSSEYGAASFMAEFDHAVAPSPSPSPSPSVSALPVSLVQSNAGSAYASSENLSFKSPERTGDFIMVHAVWVGTGALSSVSDSLGNKYQAATSVAQSPGGNSQQIFYAANVKAGLNTVSVKVASSNVIVFIQEYSGIDATSPIDQVASASGNGSTVSSGSIAIGHSGDLLYGGVLSDGEIQSAGSGYVNLSTLEGNLSEYKIATGASSYAATATNDSSGWAAQLVAVKPGYGIVGTSSPSPSPSPSPSSSPTNSPSGVPSWSGILNPSRAIDWTGAGVVGGIPNRTSICATVNASAFGNGVSDATAAIQSALNNCQNGQVVSLSAGTFLIEGQLNIPSNVTLRGAGANQTVLNAKGHQNAVVSLGSGSIDQSASVSITGGTSRSSSNITVSSSSGISVGSYLLINELNDPSFVNINGSEGACTWCDVWGGTRAAGQIVEVTSKSGNSIGITPGLFISYTRSPLATPLTSVTQFAGVEDLQVYANNTGYTSNFGMNACADCWIKGVEGNYADGNHVTASFSYHSSIVDSYFSNAYSHDPGQTDADVDLESSSTGMLVQNNILERLHVSVMLEWGAAGNVIAYNYMLGNFASGTAGAIMPNINTHGAHPMYNLIEGNIGASLHPDSIWGSSSDLTFFRNWAQGTTKICPTTGRVSVNCSNGVWGFQAARAIDLDFLVTSTNLVGDVIGSQQMQSLVENYGSPGSSLAQVNSNVAVCGPSPCGPGSRGYDNTAYGYSIGFGESSDDGSSGFDSLVPYSTLFLHGEYSNITGQTTWASGATHSLPASFYLKSKPSWFGSASWPVIGPDVSGGTGPGGHANKIPAELCYENVLHGTDGTGSPMPGFNAATCYGE